MSTLQQPKPTYSPSPNASPSLSPTDGSTEPLAVSDLDSDTESATKVPKFTPSTSSLILNISTSGIRRNTLHLSSSSTGGSELYTAELHSVSKPHVILTSNAGIGGQAVGSITFHPLSRKITIQLHRDSQPIEITHKGVFKSGYVYTSPALNGQKLEWQSSGGSTAVLVDEKGSAIAKLQAGMSRLTPSLGERSIEIVGEGVAKEKKVQEEILLSALSVMEVRRRRARNSAGGAGGTGGTG